MAIGLLAAGQVGSAPPIKMGLWEATSNVTAVVPGPMNGKPQIKTMRFCLTAETWRRALIGAPPAPLKSLQNALPETCTMSNIVNDAKVSSWRQTCSAGGDSTTVWDSKTTIDNPELVQMTSTVKAQFMMGHPLMTMTRTSKFIGADCGSVKPFQGVKEMPH